MILASVENVEITFCSFCCKVEFSAALLYPHNNSLEQMVVLVDRLLLSFNLASKQIFVKENFILQKLNVLYHSTSSPELLAFSLFLDF